jgi:hypothetical protein
MLVHSQVNAMCVCVCVCLCVCTCVYLQIVHDYRCVRACVWVCGVCVRICMCVYVRAHTHIHNLCVLKNAHTHTHIHNLCVFLRTSHQNRMIYCKLPRMNNCFRVHSLSLVSVFQCPPPLSADRSRATLFTPTSQTLTLLTSDGAHSAPAADAAQ